MKNGITHDNIGINIKDCYKKVLEEADEVYICPSFGCNLNCPHCTLKNIRNEGDIGSIINSINIIKSVNPNVSFTLFGGEPSLLKDEVLLAIRNAIGESDYSVSTNLINFSDTFLQILKEADLPDTSWNPQRFYTKDLYDKWLNNIKILKDNNIIFELMITLTKDLIGKDPQEFIDKVLEWGVKYIKLEFMIGDSTLNPENVDEWLVKLYKLWYSNKDLNSYENVLFDRIRDVAFNNVEWEGNCNNTLTILPSGNIKERCPYYECKIIKEECYNCEYYRYCKGGCPIQDKCVFPKKLFNIIKKERDVQ